MFTSARKYFLGAGVLTAALTGISAAPASAINHVTCSNRTDYMRVQNKTVHCFANGGVLQVHISGVKKVRSGNNKVRVEYLHHGHRVWGSWLAKNHSRNYTGVTVVAVEVA